MKSTAFNDLVLTGIKPTGRIHLGNYFGTIRPALELAKKYRAYYFIAILPTGLTSRICGSAMSSVALPTRVSKRCSPTGLKVNTAPLVSPEAGHGDLELEKGPNIKPLPIFDTLPDRLEGPVLLKMGDDISTDEIMPAGAAVLTLRSNIPEISRFAFSRIDDTYYDRAMGCASKTKPGANTIPWFTV